jgi:hypothetical protein
MSGKSTVAFNKSLDKNGNVEINALVHGDKGINMFTIQSPDAATNPTPESYSDEDTSGDHQKWGPNDDDPTQWRWKLEKSTTALPLIAKQVSMMYGMGLVYYKEIRSAEGISMDFTPIEEIDEFIRANDLNSLMLERMMDYRFNNNLWCEYLLSRKKDKIVNIYHLESEFCRFGKVAGSSFVNVLYSGNWPSPKTEPSPIPYIQRRDLNPEAIKKKSKFCTHNSFPMPGRTIYSIPAHIGLYRNNGWLDYANSVPEIMNSVNKNVMDLKYHIRIPYEYWPSINSDWNNLTQPEKEAFIQAKLQEMNDWLTGTKNAGKTFISHFATDEITGKPLSGWEIIELNQNGKKDQYLTTVQEADTQTARSIQMDVSLAGIQPAGGKMGAGSGSDKRVAFSNQVSVSFSDIEVITHPLRVVQMYNQWDPEVKWTFMHQVPTSLNEDKSGTKVV